MSSVASRELRNNTRGVLERVAAGEDLEITVDGRPVARLSAMHPTRPRWVSRDALLAALGFIQADPGLTADLDSLLPETTDDLDPL
ncbi:MAG: type II toxin-antitoxin system prevent-host-death family antitoxin [Trueperaceae bacterium]|jgi:prevent-host-death family protein